MRIDTFGFRHRESGYLMVRSDGHLVEFISMAAFKHVLASGQFLTTRNPKESLWEPVEFSADGVIRPFTKHNMEE